MVSEILHGLLVLFLLGRQWGKKNNGKYVKEIKLLTWRLGSNVKWRGSQYALQKHTSNDLTSSPHCQCPTLRIDPQTDNQTFLDLSVELTLVALFQLLEHTSSVCKLCLSQSCLFFWISLFLFFPCHRHSFILSLFLWSTENVLLLSKVKLNLRSRQGWRGCVAWGSGCVVFQQLRDSSGQWDTAEAVSGKTG